MIKILYFAKLREQLNTVSEEMDSVSEIADLSALIDLLRLRNGVWAEAFGADQTVLMAVNQEVAHRDTPVKDGDEIAFFPPVTGG